MLCRGSPAAASGWDRVGMMPGTRWTWRLLRLDQVVRDGYVLSAGLPGCGLGRTRNSRVNLGPRAADAQPSHRNPGQSSRGRASDSGPGPGRPARGHLMRAAGTGFSKLLLRDGTCTGGRCGRLRRCAGLCRQHFEWVGRRGAGRGSLGCWMRRSCDSVRTAKFMLHRGSVDARAGAGCFDLLISWRNAEPVTFRIPCETCVSEISAPVSGSSRSCRAADRRRCLL